MAEIRHGTRTATYVAHCGIHTDRQGYMYAAKQASRQAVRQAGIQVYRQIDMQTGSHQGKQAGNSHTGSYTGSHIVKQPVISTQRVRTDITRAPGLVQLASTVQMLMATKTAVPSVKLNLYISTCLHFHCSIDLTFSHIL